MGKNLNLKLKLARGLILVFLVNSFGPTPLVQAQEFYLPAPGMMVRLSPEFNPPILKGIKVHPNNPFRFDFILDQGDFSFTKSEATKLIKYFLASLTIAEKDLWVNLSPYEKNRIIPQSFGLTEMGRDLLAEDYMLKQITASLIYPEDGIGKKFWKRVYEEAAKKYGTTNIPVNTFNKVWIVPEKAVVYENAKAGTAYIVESKLKVMLEEDYLSIQKHADVGVTRGQDPNINHLGSQIIREIVIPELTKEVNEGKNFAQLRQVYNSLILATWYKKKIKDSILEQVYADKNKIQGLVPHPGQGQNKNNVEYIYQRYLKAFKKGVYNYIKEEQDPMTQQTIPRKYFSGGVDVKSISRAMSVKEGIFSANYKPDSDMDVTVDFAMTQAKLHPGTSEKVVPLKDLIKENAYLPGRISFSFPDSFSLKFNNKSPGKMAEAETNLGIVFFELTTNAQQSQKTGEIRIEVLGNKILIKNRGNFDWDVVERNLYELLKERKLYVSKGKIDEIVHAELYPGSDRYALVEDPYVIKELFTHLSDETKTMLLFSRRGVSFGEGKGGNRGLGLFIAKGLCKDLGGKIRLADDGKETGEVSVELEFSNESPFTIVNRNSAMTIKNNLPTPEDVRNFDRDNAYQDSIPVFLYSPKAKIVSKQSFINAGLKSSILWSELIHNGYIDSKGAIQTKLLKLQAIHDLDLDKTFDFQKKQVYGILENVRKGLKSIADIRKELAKVHPNVFIIWTDLIINGYIDSEGLLQSKFLKFQDYHQMDLPRTFNLEKKQIYDILLQSQDKDIVQWDNLDRRIYFSKLREEGKLRAIKGEDGKLLYYWMPGERNKWTKSTRIKVKQTILIPKGKSDWITFEEDAVIEVGEDFYKIWVEHGRVKSQLAFKGGKSKRDMGDFTLGKSFHDLGTMFRFRVDQSGVKGSYRMYLRSREQDCLLAWEAVPDISSMLGAFNKPRGLKKTFGNVDKIQGLATLVSGSDPKFVNENYIHIRENVKFRPSDWLEAKESHDSKEIKKFLTKALEGSPLGINANAAGVWQGTDGHQYVTIVYRGSNSIYFLEKNSGNIEKIDVESTNKLKTIVIPVAEGDSVIITSGIPIANMPTSIENEDDTPEGIADRVLHNNQNKHVSNSFPGVVVMRILDSAMTGSVAVRAPILTKKRVGGIDLTPGVLKLQTRNRDGEEIKFHMDAAMLAKFQNASGFEPEIIKFQPLKDLAEFLEVN